MSMYILYVYIVYIYIYVYYLDHISPSSPLTLFMSPSHLHCFFFFIIQSPINVTYWTSPVGLV